MLTFKRLTSIVLILCAFMGISCGCSNSSSDYKSSSIVENDSLAGKLIFLDPGHGAGNANSYGDYYEHEGNLTIALLVKKNLELCGADVVMTRSTAEDVDSYERMATVNKIVLEKIRLAYQMELEQSDDAADCEYCIEELTELINIMQSVIDDPELSSQYFNCPWNVDTVISDELKCIFEYENCSLVKEKMLFLSIHANAEPNVEDGNGSANGTVTYYLTNDFIDNVNYYTDYSYVDESRTLAEYLLDDVTEAGDFNSRGLSVNNYFMIREVNIPASLLEVAFYTNRSDREKLMDENCQQKISVGITYAVLDYFASVGT